MTKKKSKTEARRILALLTALLMVLSIFGTYSAFAEEEEELKPVEFDFAEFAPAKLTLEGEGADAQGLVFTFELTPVDGAPVPSKTKAELTKAGSFDFGKVTFTEPGRYTYKVKQTTKEAPEFTLDDTVFEIHVLIQPNDNDELYIMTTLGKEGTEEKPVEIAFKNTYTREYTELTVRKVWDDADDQDGLRPESIEVQLLADDKECTSVEDAVAVLSEKNDWTYTWKQLPKYQELTEIKYSVDELELDDYTVSIDGDAEKGFTITNSREPNVVEITVSKVWNDYDDSLKKRPESVTVTLLAGGAPAKIDDATVTLSEKNNWTYTWKELPENSNGAPVAYTVRESSVPDYSISISGDAKKGYVITNTVEPGTTSVSVSKAWDKDYNDALQLRPDDIEVTLLADGEPADVEDAVVKLNEDNKWSYIWNGLPYSVEGKVVEYTVQEAPVKGYKTTVTGDAESGYTITNELEPIYTEVSVIKIWKDSNDALKKRPKTVTVTLLADGKTADVDPATITLSEDGGWSYTWKELPAYDGARKIVYTVKETEVKDYTTVLSGDAETGFVITNTVDEPDEPDTGDRSNIVLPALLLCASIAIILVVVFTGKRARKKE